MYLFNLLPDLDIDFQNYTSSEINIINPALEKAGYKILGEWYLDRERGGIYLRAVKTQDPNGLVTTVWYG